MIDQDIIGFFPEPVTLKSGRLSHFYVNWRQASVDAWSLEQTSQFLLAYLKELPIEFDTLFGVAEGATKLSVITALKWAAEQEGFEKGSHVIAMGRGKPKAHGAPEDRYFIGMPRGRTFVIEDTATTGISLIQTIKSLQEWGVQVVCALSLTDRMEKSDDGLSVEEAVRKECQVPYLTMAKATKLLPLAFQKKSGEGYIKEALTIEFEKHGVEPLRW